MLNKVMLIGNLGADPELRHTGSGTPVCEMRLATSSRFKRNDEWAEETEWHRCIVWGRMGENCAKYLAKGRKAYVEGRIQTREWQDQSGNKRYTTEIVANNVQFLSGRGDAPAAKPQDPNAGDFSDDEIPF